eukprot:scaffold5380_cov131-Cylindrotheca_fusiformis.AAC.1
MYLLPAPTEISRKRVFLCERFSFRESISLWIPILGVNSGSEQDILETANMTVFWRPWALTVSMARGYG